MYNDMKIILGLLYPLVRCTCGRHVSVVNLVGLANLVVVFSMKHVETK